MAAADSTADLYAVILAGGSGTRFWPKSRHLRPKQLCKIGGQPLTMIELTLARLDGFIPPERRVIVTHQDQIAETKKIVGARAGHVLAEPAAKNTANALGLAALELQALAKDSGVKPVMISLHADHLVQDEAAFRAALVDAVALARLGKLTLLGVVPDYAETGFGYIERGALMTGHQRGYQVESFREKPDLKTAESYIATGRFFWNAGLFVWRVDVLLGELAKALPANVERLAEAQKRSGGRFGSGAPTAALAEAYSTLPKISIDHAVLETSTNVAVVPASFGWQDIGSWDALSRGFKPDAQGNLLFGEGCLIDTRNSTVDTDGPFVACIGLSDQVVVVHHGAVLVCPKSRAQDVKDVVQWLEAKGRRDLL